MGSVDDKKVVFDTIFTELLQHAESSVEAQDDSFYKQASLAMIRLKTLNRSLQLTLDGRRKEIESKKNNVDKLKLELENLSYKEAYLRREIRACKDLATPNLNEIEKEIGHALGAVSYSEQLESIHQNALSALRIEQEERIARQSELDALNVEVEQFNEKLDKKRKFIDDLPAKLKLIAASATELEGQFAAIKEEPNQ